MNINKITNNTWQLLNQKKGLTTKDVRICKEFKPLKDAIKSIDITKIKKDDITKEIELIKFKHNSNIGTVIKEFKKKKLISTSTTYSQRSYFGNFEVQKYTKNNVLKTKTKENSLTKRKFNIDDVAEYSKLKSTVEFNKKGLKQVQQLNFYPQNKQVKELKLNLSMTKAGEIKDITTTSKNISEESLNILKDNHYVATCTYNNENFVRIEHFQAAKNQKVENEKTLFLFKENLGKVMDRDIEGYASGNVVNLKVNDDMRQTDLVETLNHEYRHVFQYKEIKNFKNIFKRKKMNVEEKEFAKNCLVGQKKYTKKNYKDYYNNFLEVDARKAGASASNDYINTIKTLYKEFKIEDYFLSIFRKN